MKKLIKQREDISMEILTSAAKRLMEYDDSQKLKDLFEKLFEKLFETGIIFDELLDLENAIVTHQIAQQHNLSTSAQIYYEDVYVSLDDLYEEVL